MNKKQNPDDLYKRNLLLRIMDSFARWTGFKRYKIHDYKVDMRNKKAPKAQDVKNEHDSKD